MDGFYYELGKTVWDIFLFFAVTGVAIACESYVKKRKLRKDMIDVGMLCAGCGVFISNEEVGHRVDCEECQEAEAERAERGL